MLGEVDGGFAVMNEWLYATRLTVAAFSVGRARRCFDYALNYAAERKQFGQPIAKFQGVSFQVADMITEIDAADWLTLAAAWRLDQGLPSNREIASAKLYASEMLARVTDTTLQIFGGMGLMDDFPHRALLARRPCGTDLGRHLGNPAPHHQPRPPAPAGGLMRERLDRLLRPEVHRRHRRRDLVRERDRAMPQDGFHGRPLVRPSRTRKPLRSAG